MISLVDVLKLPVSRPAAAREGLRRALGWRKIFGAPRFHAIQRQNVTYFFVVHPNNSERGWLTAAETRFALSVIPAATPASKAFLVLVREDGVPTTVIRIKRFFFLNLLKRVHGVATNFHEFGFKWRRRAFRLLTLVRRRFRRAVNNGTPALLPRSQVPDLDAIDFSYFEWAIRRGKRKGVVTFPPPFNRPEFLPPVLPAAAKKNSAVFLHNNFYHFNVLGAALKRRGWDVQTVSVESPDSPQRQFYHGEDVNLFDADPDVMQQKIASFFCTAPERFGALHFCGMGYASFFPENGTFGEDRYSLPWDFLELRRHQTLIGYMPSGCMDGAPQSLIREVSGACSRCVWESRPDVCSDRRSTDWAQELEQLCDWIGLEGDWAVGARTGPKYVRGPVVTALDRNIWSENLEIPDDVMISRQSDEILIYHAVGNYGTRRTEDRDIKGTGAIMAAVERLKAEGHKVQLFFATNIPSTRVRFLQSQADIVVDQLNYGRYGANARESLMLGKPVICRLDPRQGKSFPALRPIAEAPIVSADERDVYSKLLELVNDKNLRRDIGRRSREFALKWHDSDVCAERYERVINRVRDGLTPDSADLYPAASSLSPTEMLIR